VAPCLLRREKAGVDLFHEGEHADFWWVLVDGALDLMRHIGREDTVVGKMDVPGRWAGGVAGGNPRRKTAARTAGYLEAKAPFLDYPAALAAGWPIATGVIEGACRHLVKDRMDITGARWGVETAEAILKLRAIWANGDFDAYWDYHLRREHERNYPGYALAA